MENAAGAGPLSALLSGMIGAGRASMALLSSI
jgi:hypothetical protein